MLRRAKSTQSIPDPLANNLATRSPYMDQNPAFTAELDIARGSSYVGFISGVRRQLVHHAGATRHLELVQLPHQQEDPRKAPWFVVALRRSSAGDSVLLRVRADNLYLCGYRSQDGRWREFRGSSLIAGATPLSFADSYGDMERAAKTELEKLSLGKNELDTSARQLAAAAGGGIGRIADSQHQQDIARSLMTISVMVCEAIRFRSVAGVLHHMMCNAGRNCVRLPAHMVQQVKNWRSLSEYWLGAVLYGQTFLPYIEADDSVEQRYDGIIPRRLLAPTKINCQDHAMMALGVVLNRQRELQDKHQGEMDEHWCAVRALARKLDKARPSASGV